MIFLSFSSKDRPIVMKIAFALINEGVNVWLDKLEIEAGEDLTSKVNLAIDRSSLVILFLSPDSINSNWVRSELSRTLEIEEKTGTKILLPVMLRKCELFPEIKDRLYADFTDSITLGTNELIRQLNRKEQSITPNFEEMFVPIQYFGLIYLDKNSLEKRLEYITKRYPKKGINSKQVLILYNEQYIYFKKESYKKYDELKNDEVNNARFLSGYLSLIQKIDFLENINNKGLYEILSKTDSFNYLDIATSCYWFSKAIMTEIGFVYSCFLDNLMPEEIRKNLLQNPFGLESEMKKFYEVFEDFKGFDIWVPGKEDEYLRVKTPIGSYIAKESDMFSFSNDFKEYYDPEFIFKFLVPQNVSRHLINPKCSMWWNFKDAKIGLA